MNYGADAGAYKPILRVSEHVSDKKARWRAPADAEVVYART